MSMFGEKVIYKLIGQARGKTNCHTNGFITYCAAYRPHSLFYMRHRLSVSSALLSIVFHRFASINIHENTTRGITNNGLDVNVA